MLKILKIGKPSGEMIALIEWIDGKANVSWSSTSKLMTEDLLRMINFGIDAYIPQQDSKTHKWSYLGIISNVKDELFLENLAKYLELCFDFKLEILLSPEIPEGPYCYKSIGQGTVKIDDIDVPSLKIKMCPFYTYDKKMKDDTGDDIKVAYCELIQDYDVILLNDQCKICGINWHDNNA